MLEKCIFILLYENVGIREVWVKGYCVCTLTFVFLKKDLLILTRFFSNGLWFILFCWHKFNYGTVMGLGDINNCRCHTIEEVRSLIRNFCLLKYKKHNAITNAISELLAIHSGLLLNCSSFLSLCNNAPHFYTAGSVCYIISLLCMLLFYLLLRTYVATVGLFDDQYGPITLGQYLLQPI